jgi:hypothetical protein
MDLINKIFMEYLDKFVIVFINDILVCTNDEEEHEEHLSYIAKVSRPYIIHQVKQVRVLDKASVFLKSHHFRRRHICGSKQDTRCAKLEYTH